jgi:hypothetical protein
MMIFKQGFQWFMLAVIAVGLAGCDNNSTDGNTASNNDAASTSQQSSPTLTQENEYVSFVRTVPPEVRVNEEFTVKVIITAKQDFQLLAASDSLPEGMIVVGGSPTSFIADAVPDQLLEFEYRAKITRQGTFNLPGTARAKPPGQDSVAVNLTSTITAK